MLIRQKILVGVFIIAVFFSVTIAYAEDTTWSLGLKGWSNSWEEKFSGGTIKFDSSILMMGPSLNLRKDQLFGSISYLTSSSDYKSSKVLFSGDSLTSKRNDLDIIGGYMLHPRYGIFVGYKSISADASYSYPYTYYGIYSNYPSTLTGSGSLTLTGPGIGITGNYPVENMPLSLYGSIGWMSLKYKFDFTLTDSIPALNYTASSSSSTSNDVSGTSIELGASYSFSDNMSANLGFKNQSFSGGGGTSTFSGFTLGVNHNF